VKQDLKITSFPNWDKETFWDYDGKFATAERLEQPHVVIFAYDFSLPSTVEEIRSNFMCIQEKCPTVPIALFCIRDPSDTEETSPARDDALKLVKELAVHRVTCHIDVPAILPVTEMWQKFIFGLEPMFEIMGKNHFFPEKEGDTTQSGSGKYISMYNVCLMGKWEGGLLQGDGVKAGINFIYEGNMSSENHFGTGKGKLRYRNGIVYEGDFKDSHYEGQGKYTSPDGSVYTGSLVQSFYKGQGTMVYPNGDVYEGEWLHDQKQGQGKMKFANGDVFVGTWEQDNINGPGTRTKSNGDVVKEIWKNGFLKTTE
jgi:hypothetical protein